MSLARYRKQMQTAPIVEKSSDARILLRVHASTTPTPPPKKGRGGKGEFGAEAGQVVIPYSWVLDGGLRVRTRVSIESIKERQLVYMGSKVPWQEC